jgi:hypothetical protein
LRLAREVASMTARGTCWSGKGDLTRLDDLRHYRLQRQANIDQNVVLVLEVQLLRADRYPAVSAISAIVVSS